MLASRHATSDAERNAQFTPRTSCDRTGRYTAIPLGNLLFLLVVRKACRRERAFGRSTCPDGTEARPAYIAGIVCEKKHGTRREYVPRACRRSDLDAPHCDSLTGACAYGSKVRSTVAERAPQPPHHSSEQTLCAVEVNILLSASTGLAAYGPANIRRDRD